MPTQKDFFAVRDSSLPFRGLSILILGIMASFLVTLTGLVASVAVLSVIGYLLLLVLSRYFLSSLGKLPGPKLAALTTWYEAYYGNPPTPLSLPL